VKIGDIEFKETPLFLAPLEDITDPSFRKICKEFGTDVMYTEFISSEGLIRDADKSVRKLHFSEQERPIGIQVFGHNVESMAKAAIQAEGAGPDIIDINFGCPVKKVVSKGAGAAMLKTVPLMIQITEAVVKATKLPVTVKTRLGWDENTQNIVEVAERLQDTGISAIAIHARTRSQLYRGTADWTLIGKVKNNPRMKIPVIGNGDIDDAVKAKEMISRYGVDGIMIGRAAIGNPWIFREIKHYFKTGKLLVSPGISERVDVCRRHLVSSVNWKGEKHGVLEMRQHYSNYFKGLPDFKKHKIQLMTTDNFDTVNKLFDDIIIQYGNSSDDVKV